VSPLNPLYVILFRPGQYSSAEIPSGVASWELGDAQAGSDDAVIS
jgi:hypothetical protein